MLLVLFTMAFVLGPAIFLVLVRYDTGRWPLALAASVLVVLGFLMRSQARLAPTVDLMQMFLSISAIWLAWILVLVLVARAMRQVLTTPAAGRWSRAICAMGTTIPWFGFATAQLMAE